MVALNFICESVPRTNAANDDDDFSDQRDVPILTRV